MKELFQIKTDIPEKHLHLIMVCNSQRFIYQQSFYELKHKILTKYGHFEGYDLQIIKKKCWKCNGSGEYEKGVECYSCMGTGIYHTNYYILKRYKLNDSIFHVPIIDDPLAVTKYKSKCKNTINGLVQHRVVPGNALLCYGLLLWIYDQNQFFLFIGNYGKALNTRAKHKWRIIMHESKSVVHGFAKYCNLTLKDHQPDADDLPF